MSIKRIISVIAALILVMCSVVSIKAIEPEAAEMKIIDVSTWNNSINWSVASGNVDGVIARIGYRGSVYHENIAEDSLFYSHMNSARQYSLPFGVYFYSIALNEEEAAEEANWVINRLKYYNCKPDMPIYIDAEDSVQQSSLTNRQRTDIILAFCKTMKNNGYYAGVYANKYWLTSLVYPSEFSDYPVWVAQYNSTCTYSGKYGMWQYTETGTVNGINGGVDISECYCNYPLFIKKYGYNGYDGSEEPADESKDYSKRGTYSVTSSVTVRIGASESYTSMGTLPAGSEVYVDYASDGWGIIPYSNSTGWIKLNSSVKKSSGYITTKSELGYYIVNTDVLNVRGGPTTDYTKISELYYGETVFISGVQNGWGYYYGGGGKRWICLDYAVFHGTVCFETGVSGKYIQPVRIKTGTSGTLPKWNISQTDKAFSGWSLTSGGAVKYTDGAKITMGSANVVLYAVNVSKAAYTFAKSPRESQNGMAVISTEGMKSADFIKTYISLSGGYTCSMKNAAGTLTGTGSEVTFSLNGKAVSKLTVVLSGDCNGDGICDGIDLADALNISQGTKSTVKYSDAQKKAADVNLDGKVDSADITIIRNVAFGSADLPS